MKSTKLFQKSDGIFTWVKPRSYMTKHQKRKVKIDDEAAKTLWKAYIPETSRRFPQIEIRKYGLVIVISKRGYRYSKYDTRQTPSNIEKWKAYCESNGTPGKEMPTVHIVANDIVTLTYKEFAELQVVFAEAQQALDEFDESSKLELEKEKEEKKLRVKP